MTSIWSYLSIVIKNSIEEIDTTIDERSTLKIIKNLNKNLILDIYDNNLNLNPRINLDIIYNNFNTNKYLPVIKYYIKNEPFNFKLNKEFIQKHDYSEIDSLLRNKLHPKIKIYSVITICNLNGELKRVSYLLSIYMILGILYLSLIMKNI